jgi:luciferase family oxidoreductase group 1
VTLSLCVLDQSPIRQGGTARDAFDDTIALAKACDQWGYRRYWLAEHHNTRSFAGSSPEVLIPRVAAETKTIRVGSGGVMLPHYSPLKVAENFRILETLYPDRIDLGLGRAPGGDQITAAALQAGPQAWGIETFPQQVNLLRHYLEESAGAAQWPADHPYKHVHAMPRGPGMPQMWMLGSTAYGGILAAELGLPFAYAHFISREDDGPDICAAYRERFKPRRPGDRPHIAVCVFVLAADTDETAERLAMTRNLWVMQLLANQAGGFPHPDAARDRAFSDAERTLMTRIASRGVTGEPARVKDGILRAVETYGADEFFCLTITYDFKARLRSYELIAEAFANR